MDVRVSKEMRELMDTLSMINYFVWPTDIAYSYTLDRCKKEFDNCLEKNSNEKLDFLKTEAFIRKTDGRVKYDKPLSQLFEHLSDCRVNIYKSGLILFSAAFEHYLENKTKSQTKSKKYKQGTLLATFYSDEYLNSKYPIKEKTIHRADICKHIRNKIAHDINNLALKNIDASQVIFDEYFDKLTFSNTKKEDRYKLSINETYRKRYVNINEQERKILYNQIKQYSEFIFKNAKDLVDKKLVEHNIKLDHMLLYMIFTFTNYTKFAFELEEHFFDEEQEKYTEIMGRTNPEEVRIKEMIVKNESSDDKLTF